VREIALTQGLVALVDDDVFDELSQFKWFAHRLPRTFYAERQIPTPEGQVTLGMHRAIMDAPKGVDVDHIDHDGLNNLRANLRVCSRQQNRFNSRGRHTSAFKGVNFQRDCGRWQSRIQVGGRQLYLGLFSTPEEAARAYDAAALAHFGEFAYLNFPVGSDR